MSVRLGVIGVLALSLSLAGCAWAGGGPQPVTKVVTVTAQPPSTIATRGTGTPAPQSPSTGRPSLSWNDLFTKVQPMVMRLSTTRCDGGGSNASGFLVGPDLVMTASHVVHDARTISVQTESGRLFEGKAVGDDPRHDVGLVRLDRALSIQPLALQPTLPGRGSKIAVVGYPFGVENLRITEGLVTGVPVPINVGGVQYVERAFTTDAATNGGNSGGPAFSDSGEVVGLVSAGLDWQDDENRSRPAQGTNFLIPGDDLVAALDTWRSRTADLASPCPGEDLGETDTDVDFPVTIESEDPYADIAAQTLHSYGQAISTGAYQAAWERLSRKMQGGAGGFDAFKSGLVSSRWTDLTVTSATLRSDGGLQVGAVLTTTQDSQFGPDGHTCSVWKLTYSLVENEEDGTYLVDGAKGSESGC